MWMFLYHFLWTTALAIVVPVVGLLRIGSMQLRNSTGIGGRLADRLAWRLPGPLPQEGALWIHALSVGEVISALPLVDGLSRKFPDREIVFTATTETGLAVAREKLNHRVRIIFPMPMDDWWSVRRVVHFVKPALFILVETDIWPGLLDCLKRKGIQSILVNGRVSPRTFKAYRRAPFLVRKMFEPLHKCLMQSELDRQRLLEVGLDNEKIITAGNIKFDRETASMSSEEYREWLDTLCLEPADPLWVAGSTHPGEEEVLLEAFKKLGIFSPRLRLIIAPRDTGRSDEIVRMSREKGFNAVLKTQVSEKRKKCGDLMSGSPGNSCFDVLVLDTMGELGRVYGLGSVCFVGGSLVPVGGHNLLEPASFGIPVVFGPHTHNFVSMSESLLAEGGGRRVKDGNELYETLRMLLEDEGARSRMGGRANAFVEKNRGSLERVLGHVQGCVENGRRARGRKAA